VPRFGEPVLTTVDHRHVPLPIEYFLQQNLVHIPMDQARLSEALLLCPTNSALLVKGGTPDNSPRDQFSRHSRSLPFGLQILAIPFYGLKFLQSVPQVRLLCP
jgi:hypothetical protein